MDLYFPQHIHTLYHAFYQPEKDLFASAFICLSGNTTPIQRACCVCQTRTEKLFRKTMSAKHSLTNCFGNVCLRDTTLPKCWARFVCATRTEKMLRKTMSAKHELPEHSDKFCLPDTSSPKSWTGFVCQTRSHGRQTHKSNTYRKNNVHKCVITHTLAFIRHISTSKIDLNTNYLFLQSLLNPVANVKWAAKMS